MKNAEQLRQEIESLIREHVDSHFDPNPVVPLIVALIESEKRKAVDEFQDRLDEKEFTLGNDTTTPAIVYQWMQEVTDEMFPTQQ